MKRKVWATLALGFASTSIAAAQPAPAPDGKHRTELPDTTALHAAPPPAALRKAVDGIVQPLMREQDIPGMAIGIIDGDRAFLLNYGVASRQTGKPVTDRTLFEVGSVTKTFTATLASLAQARHQLSLADTTAKYLPALADTAFGKVTLQQLGTHSPGGFPLQVPSHVHTEADLMTYLAQWRPSYAPGTHRNYTNPGIGMLGLIAARSMGRDYHTVLDRDLFPALGLHDTFVDLPEARRGDYAQGYTKQGAPSRMTPDVLSPVTYGVKTTAADLLRFVGLNMGLGTVDPVLRQAITATHTGYFRAGPFTQDLVWEQYPYPAPLQALVEGNASAMALQTVPVTPLAPPQAPTADTWINKTGATNGFGAYVAFIPAKRMGVVLLANRNYPNEARVRATYAILEYLEGQQGRAGPR